MTITIRSKKDGCGGTKTTTAILYTCRHFLLDDAGVQPHPQGGADRHKAFFCGFGVYGDQNAAQISAILTRAESGAVGEEEDPRRLHHAGSTL